MTRPSLPTRVAGAPRMALLLFVAYASIVLRWYQGSGVPWWLAPAATLAAARTLSAVAQVRRYKAWSAQWQAMGEPPNMPPQPPKRPRRRWALLTGAALIFVGIPAYLSQSQDSEEPITGLTWLWAMIGFYLAYKIIRRVMRRTVKRRKARSEIATAKAEATPVTWLVNPPSSTPTRRSAEKNLPEYCARLVTTQQPTE
jgi:amino acid permease